MPAFAVVTAGTVGSYADLVAKIALWLDRDDLSDRINDFIALAEARFNRELRTLLQETPFSFTTSAASYAMPDDYRRLSRIWIDGAHTRPLSQIAGQTGAERYHGETGIPKSYYFEGRTIYFMPPPNGSFTFNSTYLARIAPLTLNNQTNWLLEEHPDAYLFATLLEAAVYIRDAEAIAYLDPRVTDTIAAIKLESAKDAVGRGPLSPQGPIQMRGGRC